MTVMKNSKRKFIKRKLEIWEHQKPHYRRLVDILSNNYGYVDNSDTGTGKTILTMAVNETFGNKMFVVAPKSTLDTWKKRATEYGVKLEKVLSYSSLQGIEDKELNHDYLIRKDKQFYPTDKFKKLVTDGVLLIFDEFQNIKNDNPQFASAYALAKCIIEMSKNSSEPLKSGIALLSATPIDKKDHSVSLLKMLGIITEDKLLDVETGEALGLQQVIDYCEKLDPDTTKFIASQPINKSSVYDICLDLYVNIIKRHLSSALPPIIANKDAKNGYYNFPEKDNEILGRGISMLSTVCINFKKKSNNITSALTLIEKAKTSTMVRLAKEQLDRDPNCKVLLYFKYLENIHNASELLSEFSPLKIIGSSSEEERASYLSKFQANDNKYRVIISNPQVSGVGVELDDKYGNHERFMYMIPNYYFIDSHQTAGRICRAESKSVGHIRFVYSKMFPNETSIINAMMRKNKVLRSVIDDPERIIILPGEYGIEIEGVENFDKVKHLPDYSQYLKLWNVYG